MCPNPPAAKSQALHISDGQMDRGQATKPRIFLGKTGQMARHGHFGHLSQGLAWLGGSGMIGQLLTCYRSVQRGGLFSRNAFIPSWASAAWALATMAFCATWYAADRSRGSCS